VGAADQLPLAERAASLVLVADLSGSDLTESRRSAWLQALAPRRGVAIFGSPSASQLDEGKLRTGLSGQPGVQVFRQGTGLCVSCRREPDLGADQWSQKSYDASNARISHDETFQSPFLPAWDGLPMHLGYWGDTMVSANGRAYLVWRTGLSTRPSPLSLAIFTAGSSCGNALFRGASPETKTARVISPGGVVCLQTATFCIWSMKRTYWCSTANRAAQTGHFARK
jgi:hypothetical protein